MKSKSVEVYVTGFTNRFVTVTGHAYQEGEIVEESEGLLWLLEKYLKREKDSKTISQNFKSYLTDEEIIEKASTAMNKEKFISLWAENTEGYTSFSESDLALTSILAFYASGDYEQIDRLFRKSKLFREKWYEKRGSKTYGEKTIEKAISSLKEVYSSLPKLGASLEFRVEKLKEMGLSLSSKYSWTDIGAGRIFADFYEDTLRFVPEKKSWYFYESGIWIQDTGNLKVTKLCMKIANLLHILAPDIEDEFVDLVLKKKTSELNQTLRSKKKELEEVKNRVMKLDLIVQNLYEDNLEGKISEQRFEKMARSYDEEENTLQKKIAELKETITKSQKEELNVESFLKLVRKYTDIKELDPEIIRTFVDKIYVEQSEEVPGIRLKKQIIWIYWNFIGKVNI